MLLFLIVFSLFSLIGLLVVFYKNSQFVPRNNNDVGTACVLSNGIGMLDSKGNIDSTLKTNFTNFTSEENKWKCI